MTKNMAVINAFGRYVATSNGQSSGSGVIISTNIIMSCFHCLQTNCGIKVNGNTADIVVVDPKHDLMLLSVQTAEFETICLGDVDLGDVVFSVSNAWELSGSLMFGRVVWQSDERIVHDMHGMPGVSGSGLFNSKGELVGINHSVLGHKHVGSSLTVAVPTREMQEILLKVFSIVQPTAEEVREYGVAHEEDKRG